MIIHLGSHQLIDVWKRNARIEPYEGTAVLLYHICTNLISVNHVPVYLPYAAFHSEVRCSTKLFCGNMCNVVA